jgi:HK97 gp10 family phage protein
MSGEVQIKIDDSAIRAMFDKAPEETQKTVHNLLEKSGIETMAIMRLVAPVGVTGDMRRSAHYIFRNKEEVIIEPTALYAPYVEFGTKPHWTSIKPGTALYKWAMQKGIPPFALQRSIAKKGTKAHPFIQPTYDEAEPVVQSIFNDGIMDLARRLNG